MNVLLAAVAWLVGWGGGGESLRERRKRELDVGGRLDQFFSVGLFTKRLGKGGERDMWGWVGADCRIDGKEGNGWKKCVCVWGGGGGRTEMSGD